MELSELKKLFWEEKIHKLVEDTFLEYEKDEAEQEFTQEEYGKWIKEMHLSQFTNMICVASFDGYQLCMECSIDNIKVIEICPIAVIFTLLKSKKNTLAYGFSKKKTLKIGFLEFVKRFPQFYMENLRKWNEVKKKFLINGFV